MTKFTKTLLIVAFGIACFYFSPAKANGIPVIDTTSIAHMLTQLEKMTQDYQNQIQQLDQAISTYNSLTGGRNIGDLLNSSPQQDLRRALPADLQDMIGLNYASGLGTAGLQTQNIYNDLLTTYNPITGA
ncbi:MAG: type IV secretion system protein, partial [Alphaproteobacteria bacterium]|nr:type IV secretion system protein [Alphaproteobacteria bacterium]